MCEMNGPEFGLWSEWKNPEKLRYRFRFCISVSKSGFIQFVMRIYYFSELFMSIFDFTISWDSWGREQYFMNCSHVHHVPFDAFSTNQSKPFHRWDLSWDIDFWEHRAKRAMAIAVEHGKSGIKLYSNGPPMCCWVRIYRMHAIVMQIERKGDNAK